MGAPIGAHGGKHGPRTILGASENPASEHASDRGEPEP